MKDITYYNKRCAESYDNQNKIDVEKMRSFNLGGYTVSCDGVVKNINGTILKSAIGTNGYKFVSISYKGKPIRFSLHRLLALVYIPNPNHYYMINHIDSNKLNNSLENLEWCTRKMNAIHARDNNLVPLHRTGMSGKLSARSKPVIQMKSGMEIARFESCRLASLATSINLDSIYEAVKGRYKQAGGFQWVKAIDFIDANGGEEGK